MLTCKPGGKAAYFRAIRAFYRWVADEEMIAKTPVDRLKAPKVPRPLRQTVNVKIIKTLLDACESARDRLIVSMLADTGLRLSELATIKSEDVDLESYTIRVWGKGARQRVVRFGPQTDSLLNEYLSSYDQSEVLFGMKPRGIAHMLQRLETATGIKCNAHAFRRTFACESVRNGMNLFYVQSLLGHSSLTMTRIYAEQVNSEDAIKAFKPIVR